MNSLYFKTAKYSIITAAVLMLFIAVPSFAAKKNTKPQPLPIVQNILSSITLTASAATTTDAPATAETTAATSTTPAPADTATTSSSAPSENPADPTPANTAPPADTSTVITLTPAPQVETQVEPQASTKSEEDATTTAAAVEAPKTDDTPSAVENALNAVGHAVASVTDKIFAKPDKQEATSTATTTGAIATTGIATLFAGPAVSGNVYDSNRFNEGETYKLLALALALAAAGLFLTNTEMFSRTYDGLSNAITIPNPQTRRSRA